MIRRLNKRFHVKIVVENVKTSKIYRFEFVFLFFLFCPFSNGKRPKNREKKKLSKRKEFSLFKNGFICFGGNYDISL